MNLAQHPEEFLSRVEDLYLAGSLSLTSYLVLARACHRAMEQETPSAQHESRPVHIIHHCEQP